MVFTMSEKLMETGVVKYFKAYYYENYVIKTANVFFVFCTANFTEKKIKTFIFNFKIKFFLIKKEQKIQNVSKKFKIIFIISKKK